MSSVAMKQAVIEQIEGTSLKKMMTETELKRQYIDVRTPEEFYGRSIPGFVNIPLQSLPYKLDALDPNIPIVLICASGGRSMSAAHFLQGEGFVQIINVRGGMSQYRG